MPRRARVLWQGVSLHLIQRGNGRSAYFYSEADYLFYLQCFAEQADKHDCAVQALSRKARRLIEDASEIYIRAATF